MQKHSSNIYTISIYSSLLNITLSETLLTHTNLIYLQQTSTNFSENFEIYKKSNELKFNEIEHNIQTFTENNENYKKNNESKLNEIEQKIMDINHKFENRFDEEIQTFKNNSIIEIKETANLDELEETGRYFINRFEGTPGFEYPIQTFDEKASFVEVLAGPNNTIHQTVYI